MAMAVVGWGMVSVNGAHTAFVDASGELDEQMRRQGPVIDGLGLAGADREALNAAYSTYSATEGAAQHQAALAYVQQVERAARDVGGGATMEQLRAVIADLGDQRDQTDRAREEWAQIAGSFPGVVAVGVGLAWGPE
jgi:hypothetical protein